MKKYDHIALILFGLAPIIMFLGFIISSVYQMIAVGMWILFAAVVLVVLATLIEFWNF